MATFLFSASVKRLKESFTFQSSEQRDDAAEQGEVGEEEKEHRTRQKPTEQDIKNN